MLTRAHTALHPRTFPKLSLLTSSRSLSYYPLNIDYQPRAFLKHVPSLNHAGQLVRTESRDLEFVVASTAQHFAHRSAFLSDFEPNVDKGNIDKDELDWLKLRALIVKVSFREALSLAVKEGLLSEESFSLITSTVKAKDFAHMWQVTERSSKTLNDYLLAYAPSVDLASSGTPSPEAFCAFFEQRSSFQQIYMNLASGLFQSYLRWASKDEAPRGDRLLFTAGGMRRFLCRNFETMSYDWDAWPREKDRVVAARLVSRVKPDVFNT
ncbi:hypothetical protein JCM8097_000120 [Rhodosporidiobolus ruineniae]